MYIKLISVQKGCPRNCPSVADIRNLILIYHGSIIVCWLWKFHPSLSTTF